MGQIAGIHARQILDSRGNRITNEYCEKIIAEINASSAALPRHTLQSHQRLKHS